MDTNTNAKPEPALSPGTSPEKYIRTYLSDMNIFKRGGTPSLAPLKETDPVPTSEYLIESGQEPPPVSSALSAPPMSKPLVVPVGFEIEQIKISPPIPIPADSKPPVPFVVVEESGPSPIETYSDDFRKQMKETGASTASVLAVEQDFGNHSFSAPPENQNGKYNLWYIIAGVVLLCVGGTGMYFVYAKYLAAVAPVSVSLTETASIFVDSRETISGTGTSLMRTVQQSTSESLARNTVRQLSLDASTTVSVGTNVFLAFGVHAPDILIRNMNADGSMAGIVNTSSGQAPFFILPVGSYSTTFSGMLLWEPTMQTDLAMLYPLYPVSPTQPDASSTLATTTAASPVATDAKIGFRDETINNHDVRVLRDVAGRSVLVYGYWNQTTLIIARDPMAFAEILDRLATSHT